MLLKTKLCGSQGPARYGSYTAQKQAISLTFYFKIGLHVQGLGEELALYFAAHGARLILSSRKEEQLQVLFCSAMPQGFAHASCASDHPNHAHASAACSKSCSNRRS